ncbi:MAG: HAD family hydrolase [Lachnospiraceae bacterium]|nr:HAD family hydrolase [Lachnospiraceae bacterium]MBR3263422.1 HAD family hydrolase [Lachnospiraceae bacterium]MBR3361035.1 HAD family hydrolase [Lachnospiraceae bacterium]MBR6357311.1 HAD family hydrolase [Lachnospiraceae bacterium]MBR7076014.1 HAD family hydrolase [Lachnospiraceae bacterium]
MNHTIFFDLDGTLTDSAPGIIHSVQYALKKYGIEAEENDLHSFIGPPLVHSFQERFGFDHDKALEAVTYYREYFTAGGMFENSVYPGVEEMLQKLKEDGLVLAVATSKPELFSKQILEHFALTRYFDFIGGAAMDESRATKVEVLSYALQELQVDPAKAVMIGDRENDIEAASLLGTESIGVLYGYGSQEELANAGAKVFADTPMDICRIISGWE